GRQAGQGLGQAGGQAQQGRVRGHTKGHEGGAPHCRGRGAAFYGAAASSFLGGRRPPRPSPPVARSTLGLASVPQRTSNTHAPRVRSPRVSTSTGIGLVVNTSGWLTAITPSTSLR